MLPPALLGEGTVSDKVLDQAVMESEVRVCVCVCLCVFVCVYRSMVTVVMQTGIWFMHVQGYLTLLNI